MQQLTRQLGLGTATLVVVASMIGTGIFGTSGMIQSQLNHTWLCLALWLFGGLVAIAGALCYGEIAAAIPRVGGDYIYLKEIYGPLWAFLSGWISVLVAFSAPMTISALLCTEYLAVTFPSLTWIQEYDKLSAAGLIVFFATLHARGVHLGGGVQNFLTVFKMALLLAFVIGAGYLTLHSYSSHLQANLQMTKLSVGGIGPAFLFIMFSYSGWNAAAYIGGEVRNPQRNLPIALFLGTLIVAFLYFLMNLVFYSVLSVAEITGVKAVGALAAKQIFGVETRLFFNLGFCLVLLSSISVNMMLGPRVCYAMAKDGLFFQQAAKVHHIFKTPLNAIGFQVLIALVYLVLGSYEQILTYMGFSLSIFPLLTVAGMFRLRRQRGLRPNNWTAHLRTILAGIFMMAFVTMILVSLVSRPFESLTAVVICLLGIPVYYALARVRKKDEKTMLEEMQL